MVSKERFELSLTIGVEGGNRTHTHKALVSKTSMATSYITSTWFLFALFSLNYDS